MAVERNPAVFAALGKDMAGKDAARLSYLAEVELADAADLPAGLPLRVEFGP
mgnify:CR=1 FL=1